ncbi:MAG: cupin domain-containing protein [Bdellovibrionales bacterium]|nr:cupin domain-containing protein [Bdellovibrionales bacterium]
MKLFRRSEHQHRELTSQKTGEAFSHSQVLSEGLQSKDFFITHEIIPAGRRASGAHSHTETDEVVFVLSGYPTAVEGGEKIALSPGDSVCFQAGAAEYHFVLNETNVEAHILVIKKSVSNDIVMAPSLLS